MFEGVGFILGLTVSMFEINTAGFFPKYKGDILKEIQSQWKMIYNRSPDHSDPHSHEDIDDVDPMDEIVVFHNTSDSVHKDEDILAKELSDKVKVLCWIMTQPPNHAKKVCTNPIKVFSV